MNKEKEAKRKSGKIENNSSSYFPISPVRFTTKTSIYSIKKSKSVV